MGGVDELRIGLEQRVRPESPALHYPGAGVFEQDVGLRCQRAEALPAGEGLEVEHDRALAGVQREVEASGLEVRAVTGERSEDAEAVTRWRLDLHDLRAEVREQPAGVAAGHALADVDDQDAGQCAGLRCDRRRLAA